MLTAARGVFAWLALGPFAWLTASWPAAGHTSPSALMALAALALATAALAVLFTRVVARSGRVAAAAVPRAAALRAKSRGTEFVRQRDPDAAGRIRPRAPSAHPAAA